MINMYNMVLDPHGRGDWIGDPIVEKISEDISFLGDVNDTTKNDFTKAAARYYTSVINRTQIEDFKECQYPAPNLVRRLIDNFKGDDPATAVDDVPKAAKKALTEFAEWENVHEEEGTNDEVQQYTTQRPTAMENERDLLGWWKEHSVVYPKLAG
ncbi:hypothetical protein EOD39_9805 [Acipenser ruthenus]|uniref:Uncharacterized protein n=1 Tax=Acipenser ruthenus TaxID=7906 RepID=A0A662YWN7_ACIRT|nr:hypothetical protein EOD39_9805 [Acipenser ruthenus]